MKECLSEQQIDDFLADGLSDDEEHRLDNHLQDCAVCRELLNQMTAIPGSIHQALVDSKSDDSVADPDLDHLLGRVHFAPTLEGLRVSDETQNLVATLTPNGEPATTAKAVAGLPAVELPGYEILEELGRGGLGVVFKARQVALGRTVAVKMMLPRSFPDPKYLARFQVEAEAVAKLQHPNVVQVFDVIEREDSPFLSMEYVAGVNLAQRLAGKPQPPETAARLVEVLARAIHSVHAAGILHRDLKPANILLTSTESEAGVRLAAEDGSHENVQPKITDFGLAKHVEKDSGLTETQTALGTPSYMAPEQARTIKSVTQAADIYSLGAILYEVLVGRPPFRGSNVVETLAQLIHEEPVPPRRLVNTISVDLEAVCLKCLEKEPHRRYASAEALADDLRRVQDGLPTIARPTTNVERLWRWCRRHPVVPLLLIVTLLGGLLIRSLFVRQQSLTRAKGLVDAVLSADIAQVPNIVENMKPYRAWVDPLLHASFEQSAAGSPERLHASLAMLPVDESRVDYLRGRLHLVTQTQFPVVRDALLTHKDGITPGLWQLAMDEQQDAVSRFQATAALAKYSPDDERWEHIAPFTCQHLTGVVSTVYFVNWLEHLRPAREHLNVPLALILADRRRPEKQREAVAFALADLLQDQPEQLVDVILVADESTEFAFLVEALTPHAELAKPRFLETLRAPLPSGEAERDAHWNRQSLAAVALVQLGHADEVWQLLEFTPDPSLRSLFIHHLGKLRAGDEQRAAKMESEDDAAIRQALIESFGSQDKESISPDLRDRVVQQLQDLYREDPDPGVHASASWTLRNWGVTLPQLPRGEGVPRKQTLRGKVAIADSELRREMETVRRWYINSQGQTMVMVPSQRSSNGNAIDYDFAIAGNEVTAAQFLKFRPRHDVDRTPDNGNFPVNQVSWFLAARYCNWLSKQDGIAPDQWVYEPTSTGRFAAGMTINANFRELAGYRMPSDAEWEYACRAGTTSTFNFGEPESLMDRYGNTVAISQGFSHPVASLLPNRWGLFDMHGSLWEWCLDSPSGQLSPVRAQGSRAQRGGSYGVRPWAARSERSGGGPPMYNDFYIGFRVARSLPEVEHDE